MVVDSNLGAHLRRKKLDLSQWEVAQNMVFCKRDDGSTVDIRAEGMYEKWTGSRKGLSCYECGDKVHPRKLSSKKIILSHNPRGADDKKCSPSQHAPSKWRAKQLEDLIAARYKLRGFEVTSPPESGLILQAGLSTFEVHVKLTKNEPAIAKELRNSIRAKGHVPVLLMYNCDWNDLGDALGLRFSGSQLENEHPDSVLDMGDTFPIVDVGLLKLKGGMLVESTNAEVGLGTALDRIFAGKLLNQKYLPSHFGWATPAQWNSHLQMTVIRLKEASLLYQQQLKEIQSLNTEVGNLTRKLDIATSKLVSEQSAADKTQQAMTDLSARIRDRNAWADSVERLRDKSVIARTLMQKIPDYAYVDSTEVYDKVPIPRMVLLGIIAMITMLTIPAAVVTFYVPWGGTSPLVIVSLTILAAVGSLFILGTTCVAVSASSHELCLQPRPRLFRRCRKRTHGWNIATLALFVMLLCATGALLFQAITQIQIWLS
ncbi:hypothetical protein [Lysinibacter cavernae]|uniref:hypothetical protein n=1 Tax=Lysinibacter cavernae TaxID=1640652 RepID=UPI00361CB0CC